MPLNDCLRPTHPDLTEVTNKFLKEAASLPVGYYVLFAASQLIIRDQFPQNGSQNCNYAGLHTHREIKTLEDISL